MSKKIIDIIGELSNLDENQLNELISLAYDARAQLNKRKEAEFLATIQDYAKEIKKSFDDGYESGLNWRDCWKHKPGGPHVLSAGYKETIEWRRKARLSQDKNKAWLKGWAAGFKKKAELACGIVPNTPENTML